MLAVGPEHELLRRVAGRQDGAVGGRAELVAGVALREAHLLAAEVDHVVEDRELAEEGIAEDHGLVGRFDALVEGHLVRVHVAVHVRRVVHEGVLLAFHLLARQHAERRRREVALDVRVREQQARRARVELADKRLLLLRGVEVEQLHAAVRDRVDVDAVDVLARHREDHKLLAHQVRVVAAQLQLAQLVVGRERELARHGAAVARERLPVDVPARAVDLRERLEERCAARLVRPTEAEDAVDVVEVARVAVLDHAHARLHRVLPERRHVRRVVAAQVRVVEERHVDVVQLDQVERRAHRRAEEPTLVVAVRLPGLTPERVVESRLLLRARLGAVLHAKRFHAIRAVVQYFATDSSEQARAAKKEQSFLHHLRFRSRS
mmetsp:Transcript_43974/g.103578  ORF Transcript_43974/g.103578 Transcript_43974/m.103578 type:complete len:378 (+) Transcript_43974:3-1136(+)|eukprot:675038-Rhodomonas_salina.1